MKSLNGVAVVAAWSAIAVGGSAVAQDAVQWRVEDGGNGHWYAGITHSIDISWHSAQLICEGLGGHLATLTSAIEDDFVWDIAQQSELWVVVSGPGWTGAKGPWLGLGQAPDSSTAEGWSWVTGEPFEYHAWGGGEPNDGCTVNEDGLNYLGPMPSTRYWNDFAGTTPCPVWGFPQSFIIEWSADCNGDGIVDYGQILDGTFEDANENGVPDCCEDGIGCDPCPGDVNFDGQVNGADISVTLGFWGLNGKPNNADINNDGIVNGADLAFVLGNWGPCP